MEDYAKMIDDMTEEDIAALVQAINNRKVTCKKSDICRRDIKKIRETFYEDERYRNRGILIDNEVRDALFVLCDTVTSNYVKNTRISLRAERCGKMWKHNSFVPKSKQDLYKWTFHELLRIVMEHKVEPYFPE